VAFQSAKNISARLILIVLVLVAMYGVLPIGASAQTSTEPTSQANDCYPGSGWMWTTGLEEPGVAAHVQRELSDKGIEALVEARSYGEVDSCGTYHSEGIDFTIRLTAKSTQAKLTDKIGATLTALGKPKLGNVKLLSQEGKPIPTNFQTELSASEEMQTASLKAEPLPGDPITRKVYVIVYDPLLGNGQKLSQYLGWNSHATITQQTVDFFKQATGNKMNYVVVQTTVVTSGWPQLVDGFAYTESQYLAVLNGQQSPHQPQGVDYNRIVNSAQFDICGKANRGEIDEVWIYNGPWFGFYESTLVGPGAYWFNSSPVGGTHNCNRLIPIMGPSPERGVDEAVHNFTHRSESTMMQVYGSWQQNNTSHNWNKFALVKAQSPNYSYGGCGSSHFPMNGTSDYDYSNSASVLSNCDDFLNYPNLSNPLQVAESTNCSVWGCNQLGYFRYWFGHFPSFAGCGPDNRANDWWKYLASPAYASYVSSACQSNMHWISGNAGAPGALISYTDGSAKSVTADASGNYSLLVSHQWSGTITPSKASYIFTPASRTYTNVQSDLYVQNYAAQGGGPVSYYVNIATGNNNNSCLSKAAPCRTIQEAINKTSAGDIVKVASGRYLFSSNPSPNVVIIDKNLTLSGGWNAAFTSQIGASTIDGANTNNGLLVISGTVTVENFIVEKSTSFNGGAIYMVAGSLTLKKSTLRNNDADSGGAGIFVDNGTVNVINSTISGNRANGAGGGIYAANNSSAAITIQNSTIAYNQASRGGGISRASGSYNLTNTILANNTSSISGPDCNGTLAVVSFSLIENMSGCTITTGSNNLQLDPQIDSALTGVMLVHFPLPDSPVVDTGKDSGCPSTDQQGTPRPQGSHCDIGAVEASNVYVTIGEMVQGSYFLTPGESKRVSYAALSAGPVKMLTTDPSPMVAAERLIYKANNVATSFTEMMGLPNSQLDTTYWLAWYNNIGLDTQLRFANVSNATASVHVYIGGDEMDGSPFTLAAGGSMKKSFPGIDDGPVEIESNVNIVAAARLIYKVNGVNTSFSEIMALPASQLDTTYWLPWYNNLGLDTQLRFANVTDQTAIVRIYIGGDEMDGSPFTLAPGESTRKSFPGIDSGPVKIVSNQDIIAAERLIYKVNGIPTSFTEMMALPNGQLDTTYWLPWYNNLGLDTQLRFANTTGQTATVRIFISDEEMSGSPFTLLPGESTRKSFPAIDSGPVKIVSTRNIVVAERLIYKFNNVPASFSEMMALPDSQLDTTYWLPWYNNLDLDTQLRFGVP
jgi:uncharacterized protein YcfL